MPSVSEKDGGEILIMSPNSGFWTTGLQGTVDRLNQSLMQKGVAADFDVTQTGLTYFDTSDSKIKRSNGATWDTLVGQNTVHDTQNDAKSGTGANSVAVFNNTVYAADTETDLASTSITLAAQGAIEACGLYIYGAVAGTGTRTFKLYIDGVLAASGSPTSLAITNLKGNRVASSGARTVKVALQTAGGTGNTDNQINYVFAGVNKI